MAIKISNLLPKRRWLRRLTSCTLILFLLVIFFLLALPLVSKHYLKSWLIENGADAVTIEKLRINPFKGRLTLEGVDIRQKDKSVLSDSTLFFDLSLRSLWSKEALVEKAVLKDFKIDIERFEDSSLRIGSYRLANDEDTPREEEIDTNLQWIFSAQDIAIENVLITYKQPDLAVELIIDTAKIETFSTGSDDVSSSVTLAGTLNGAPVSLALSTFDINPAFQIKGKLQVQDFQLDNLAPLLADHLEAFSGAAGAAGLFSVAIEEDLRLNLFFDGTIDLTEAEIAGRDWSTSGTLAWKGELSSSQQPEAGIDLALDGVLSGKRLTSAMKELSLEVSEPDISIDGKTTISIADQVHVESKTTLLRAKSSLTLGETSVLTEKSSWAGTLHYNSSKDSSPMQVITDGTLVAEGTAYTQPEVIALNQKKMEIDGKTEVDLSDSLKITHQGGIGLSDTSIASEYFSADNKAFTWKGALSYNSRNDNNSMQVITDGSLALAGITYKQPEVIALNQNTIRVEGKTEVNLSDSFKVTYRGDIGLSDTSIGSEHFSADNKALTWKGDLSYHLQDNQAHDVSLRGILTSPHTSLELPDATLHLSQEGFTLTTEANISFGAQIRYAGISSLQAEHFSLSDPQNQLLTIAALSADKLSGDGDGAIFLESIAADEIFVTPALEQPIELAIASITLSGLASPDMNSFSISTLDVLNPVARDTASSSPLGRLDHLTVSGITVDEQYRVSTTSIQADNGSFLTDSEDLRDEAPITLSSVAIAPFSWSSAEGTTIGTITFTDLYGFHSKAKENQERSASPEQDESRSEKNKKTIPLTISEIRLVGNSGLTYEDLSMDLPFTFTLSSDELLISNIDLSDPSATVSYTFKGTIDKYAKLDLSGDVQPGADMFTLTQHARLRNYSLPNVSAFVAESIGTTFTDGQLDLISDLTISGQTIKSENELDLKGLEVEAVNEELAQDLNSKLPVPLDLALTMLRDNDGNIELSVPISGELSALKYGVADVIATAMTKAISKGLAPYLAYTVLGPTGALAYLGVTFGAKLLDTSFPPLTYASNISELTEEQQATLNKTGEEMEKIFAEDAEKSYSICPKVSPGEINTDEFNSLSEEARGQTLYKLGDTRATLVKQYLVENFNISEDQLLTCSPRVNFDPGASGTVEFKE